MESDGAAGNVHREPFVIRSISDTHRRKELRDLGDQPLSARRVRLAHIRPRESDWAQYDPIKYSN
jgi:hypothetical protein